jgi:hypothetical protein
VDLRTKGPPVADEVEKSIVGECREAVHQPIAGTSDMTESLEDLENLREVWMLPYSRR